MSKVYFICIVDKESIKQGKVDNLKKSLNDNLIIIDTYDKSIGNLSKLFKIRDFLQETTIIKDHDIVVAIDGLDVVWISSKSFSDFKQEFINTQLEFIVSAEKVYAKHDKELKYWFDSKYEGQRMKYVNSGMIISYKYAYLKILNDICNNFDHYEKYAKIKRAMPKFRVLSDQRVISKYMVEQDDTMKMDIDYKCQFMTTLYDIPFEPSTIDSYFVHITGIGLNDGIQYDMYNKVLDYYKIKSMPLIYKDEYKNLYNSKIQLDINVIDDIIQNSSLNKKMLVFGLGYDSKLWNNIANTYFVENKDEYIQLNSDINNIIKYDYKNINVEQSLNLTDDEISNYKIPDELINNGPYDIILVDGPEGWANNKPGRLLPIYWSINFLSKKDTIIYIDDINRELETYCVNKFCNNFKQELFKGRNGCIKLII